MNASSCCGFSVQLAMALVLVATGVNSVTAAEPARRVVARPDIELARPRQASIDGRGAMLRFEGESLLATARASAGYVGAQPMGGFGGAWSGNAQLFWQPPDPVDTPTRNWPSLTLTIDSASRGRYALAILYTRAPDYGDVRVFFGGEAVADLAGYADSVQTARVEAGRVELQAGKNQLVLSVFRRPPGSRASYVGLDALELTALDASAAQPGATREQERIAVVDRTAIATDMAVGISLCPGLLEHYQQQVSELDNGSCNRFADDRYAAALASRKAIEDCPTALALPADHAAYDVAGNSLRAFAETCTCQHLLDNMDGNIRSIEDVVKDACVSPLSAGSLAQAQDNIALESELWTQQCRGIVSTTTDSGMRARQEQANSYGLRATARCDAAAQCSKAVAGWQKAVDQVQQDVQKQCAGYLHADIATAGSLRTAAMQYCPGGLWQSLGVDDGRNAQTILDAVETCSTRDMVMEQRCKWTRESRVHRYRKVGGYEKTVDILVREHWCQEEPDFDWCQNFEQVHIEIEKGYYVIVANKETSIEMDVCVAPSVWSQCKAVNSSTGECVK